MSPGGSPRTSSGEDVTTVSLGAAPEMVFPEPIEPGPFSPPNPPRPFPHAERIQRHLSRPTRRPHRRAMTLPSTPNLFPWLAQRFSPGEATVWVGPPSAIEPMLELLYAGSAVARGRISLIEGSNRFHPFRIGELGRSLGVDATSTLERIRIARSFTAHQTVALVDGWSAEARHRLPTLLVGHGLVSGPLDDPEVPADERAALASHMARRLSTLLRKVPTPLLLTMEGGLDRFPGLVEEGPRLYDYLLIQHRPNGLTLRALRDDSRFELVQRPSGQRGLDEFSETNEREVMRWDAPRRRTAKHSKSG